MFKKKAIRSISISLVVCMTLMMMPAYASAKSDFKMNKNPSKGFGKQVNYVIGHGIFKGDGRGNYALQDYVKRGDVMVMIVRSFMFSTVFGPNFPDVEVNSYFFNAIATAKSMGIAKGDGKKFHPKKYVTIKEAIALIERSAAVANANVTIDTSVDLHDLYSENALSRYATRKDVADMLYYVLTGDTTKGEAINLAAIQYKTNEDTIIKLDADDFTEVLEDVSDEDLSYVKFTLPASTYGKLYYNYTSSSGDASLVNADTKYYVDPADGSDLAKITFVPYPDYAGTVSIQYTATDEDDKSFTGTIKISVLETDETMDFIKYTTNEDTVVKFDADDFTDVFEDISDEDLSYVKFTLPASTYGKLYYNYTSSSDDASLVTAETKYYVDPDGGSDLAKITFVPYLNYSGTMSLEYTAYDKDGGAYTGTIKITVTED